MEAGIVQEPLHIVVRYDDQNRRGLLLVEAPTGNTIWERLKQSASVIGSDARITELAIELSWASVLDILRDYGTRDQQRAYNFRFKPDTDAQARIQDFAAARKKVQEAQGSLTLTVTEEEVRSRLRALGFKRDLKWFQVRDIRHLLSIQNGANFSVPGAGKTTVAFALHLLTSQPGTHVLVVCPKAAFPAWNEIVYDTMDASGPDREAFQVLSGTSQAIEAMLTGGGRRFVINYDLLIQHPGIIGAYLARQPVHLILDESHRMKAGEASQRGALLLNFAPLPIRRDVLSGTPMPQSPSDLVSQLNFLWPGQGLGLEISRGTPPREVLGSLYVRTTKEELGLPARYTHFHQVGMGPGQMALYGLVRSESLRQLSNIRSGAIDFAGARKSVMRLLQLSSNPLLALRAITSDITYPPGEGRLVRRGFARS